MDRSEADTKSLVGALRRHKLIGRKRRKPINRPEQALQRSCVQLLEQFYEPMPDVFWTAINPVPAKSKAVAGISKAMGLKPGVFDLIFIRSAYYKPCEPEYGFALPFFIEMKAKGGQLSTAQKALKFALEAFGIRVFVVDNIEDFVKFLAQMGIHPKRKLTLRGQ